MWVLRLDWTTSQCMPHATSSRLRSSAETLAWRLTACRQRLVPSWQNRPSTKIPSQRRGVSATTPSGGSARTVSSRRCSPPIHSTRRLAPPRTISQASVSSILHAAGRYLSRCVCRQHAIQPGGALHFCLVSLLSWCLSCCRSPHGFVASASGGGMKGRLRQNAPCSPLWHPSFRERSMVPIETRWKANLMQQRVTLLMARQQPAQMLRRESCPPSASRASRSSFRELRETSRSNSVSHWTVAEVLESEVGCVVENTCEFMIMVGLVMISS
mmetsp:Transcript_47172/g.131105  ORF Transcript_47172/g.131105 Transcript_47172/m.131105 type:complete len:271 (+) Transcript_47172:120-932(+)